MSFTIRLRPLVLAAALCALLLAGAALVFVPGSRPVSALSTADVTGVYVLRLTGDAWARVDATGDNPKGSAQRVKGGAFLILTSDSERNDGVVKVELRLDRKLEGSVLDRVTGSPDFVAEGVIIGDRLTLIDSGSSIFVSAMDVRFEREGRKIAGSWLVSWPAAAADATFVGGARIDLKGKRFVPRPKRPTPEIPPLGAATAIDATRSR